MYLGRLMKITTLHRQSPYGIKAVVAPTLMASVKYRYFFRKYPNFAVIYEK